MGWIDALAAYLSGLQVAAIAVAIVLAISGLDDLLIDAAYWVRRVWRALTVYRVHGRLDVSALSLPAEKPVAILVPAWQEAGVLGPMLDLAVHTLDYEHYHIFVGTYPNDPETRREMDLACARFPNVHAVVCARPGPTSKADCLNHVLDAALRFERRVNLPFAAFVLHDAEDVIAPQELRLFNYLVPRKDLIQLPVYPFERGWTHFTSGHYLDEFAEHHGKEVPMREAIAGQVPSAGVGTCLSRRAVLALLEDGEGMAFDVQGVTEDYDIGIRLRARGMREIFVRFPAPEVPDLPIGAAACGRAGAQRYQEGLHGQPICVREYFPDTFGAAVRQKSRWIAGIVYRGTATHGWTRHLALDYFLWRDRKTAVSNFATFAALLVGAQALVLLAGDHLIGDGSLVRSAAHGPHWLVPLLWLHAVLLANRVVHRVYFVWTFYGPLEGLLSIPRLVWGAVINFAANCRAVVQMARHGTAQRIAWDKTAHEFPVVAERPRAKRPLGRILVAQGSLTECDLDAALAGIPRGLRLGSALVHAGVLTPERLAAAVGEQCGVPWEPLESLDLRRDLLRELPEELALHYAVLPIREEGTTLVVGSEGYIDPVSLAAMARRLDRPVRYVVVPKGQVTVGLRHWYLARGAADPRRPLQQAARAGRISEGEAERLWTAYVSRQLLFADILLTLGHLDPGALASVLLRHERGTLSLGETLVLHGIVSPALLKEALDLQEALQGSMESLLLRAGISPPPRTANPADLLSRTRAV